VAQKQPNNSAMEEIVRQATQIALSKNHEYVTLEHLTVALIEEDEFNELLTQAGVDVIGLLDDLYNYIADQTYLEIKNTSTPPRRTNTLERVFNRAFTQVVFAAREQIEPTDLYLSIMQESNSHAAYFLRKWSVDEEAIAELMGGLMTNSLGGTASNPGSRGSHRADRQAKITEQILAEYCTDLNALVTEGKIDPVIGRQDELEEISQVLARRHKSNVLMIGDPGVGKTAIAEGLAYKIIEKDIPEYLHDYTVFNLEIGSLLAGCKYRGEFEEKVKDVLAALNERGKAVLFIDEAHQMSGAGAGSSGSVDFANMIKPALSRGDIKVIASTTFEEYTKSFEKDRALMRRFYKLNIDEPTSDIAKDILMGLREHFEKFHHGTITDDAINAAVDLSVRFQTDKRLPDKAIDLIDMSCACLKIKHKDFIVNKEDIVKTLSKATKIPADTISSDNDEKPPEDFNTAIKSKIFGQDDAVDSVLEKIYIAKAGLKDPEKPIGNFLFLGPTGTGKTELCKQLADKLSMKLVRFDMSEYQEKHTVSRLVGAPPGYVGYEDGNLGGGLLISEVERNPNAIILFDEIEKAHPDVSNILLQIMDNGMITGSNGKRVDCRHCIIIMTSNLGSADGERNAIGFGDLEKTGEDDKAVKDFFKPEFRNRLDGIVKFDKLNELAMKQIIVKFINELNVMLLEKEIRIVAEESLVNHLLEVGFEPAMGARPLARKINELVKVPLSRKILFDGVKAGSALKLGWKKDELTITKSRAKVQKTEVVPEVEEQVEEQPEIN
jgi:ATP-dependent Clp protease ATP-binding subunit ClpA